MHGLPPLRQMAVLMLAKVTLICSLTVESVFWNWFSFSRAGWALLGMIGCATKAALEVLQQIHIYIRLLGLIPSDHVARFGYAFGRSSPTCGFGISSSLESRDRGPSVQLNVPPNKSFHPVCAFSSPPPIVSVIPSIRTR